jgi:hypothetical protein
LTTECQEKSPGLDFHPYAIDLRKKFLARVEDQLRKNERQKQLWLRQQAEYKNVLHLDKLVEDLYAETKVGSVFSKGGLYGGQPRQKNNADHFKLISSLDELPAPPRHRHHKRQRVESRHDLEGRLSDLTNSPSTRSMTRALTNSQGSSQEFVLSLSQ